MLRVDDARFVLPEFPPWDSRSSPFRSRGSVYQHHVDYAKTELPGGLSALRRALPAQTLVDFLDQAFASNEWYDIAPAAYFSRAAAKVRGVPFAQQTREFNAWTLRSKASAFYRALVPVPSPRAVAVALPHVLRIIQNFGAAEARVDARRLLAVRTGMPESLVQWYAYAVEGYVPSGLERMGARGVRATCMGAEPDGVAAGQHLYRVHFEVVWP